MEFKELKDKGGKLYQMLILRSEEMPEKDLAYSSPKIWEEMVVAEKYNNDKNLDLPADLKQFREALNDVKKFMNGALMKLFQKGQSILDAGALKQIEIYMINIHTAKNSEELYNIIASVLDLTEHLQ